MTPPHSTPTPSPDKLAETPRTDRANTVRADIWCEDGHRRERWCLEADFARKLERELSVAATERDLWKRRAIENEAETEDERKCAANWFAKHNKLEAELAKCNELCQNQDGGGSVSEVLSRALTQLRAENEKLLAERENWRMSSVCRDLKAELERANGLLLQSYAALSDGKHSTDLIAYIAVHLNPRKTP